MAQPFVSDGYDGTLDEIGLAEWHAAAATRPGIRDGFGVSIVGNVDRTIRVSPGKAYGWGVLDELTGTVDLQAEAVTSGDRWDTLVLRRDWRPLAGGPSALMILKGTSTRARSALRLSGPGVVDDQVLAIFRLRAGLSTIQELMDLREWQSSLSFRYDPNVPTASTYDYGDKIVQNAGPGRGLDVAVRRGGDGSETWDWMLSRDWSNLSLASGYRTYNGHPPQYRVVGDVLQLRGWVERSNGTTFANVYTTVASVPAASAPMLQAYVPAGGSFSSATGGGGMCNIQSDGVIQIAAPSGLADFMSFDGISIPMGA